MSLLEELFGKVPGKPDNNQHSVVVYFYRYEHEELDPLHDLEVEIREAIFRAGAGEYDGHELALEGSDGSLFMYGPDAGELFKAVKPILEQADFMRGAVAVLRFGSQPGASEIEIEL
jgi:hypothetical protein